MKRYILLLLLLALPAHGADRVMLMVNMNYSPEEMAAAKRVAQNRGQEFVVIPPESDVKAGDKVGNMRASIVKDIKRLKGATEAEAANIMSMALQYGAEGISDEKLRKQIGEKVTKYREAAITVFQTEQTRGSIAQQINQKMIELKASGKSVDSFLISAHSDGANLSGETSYMLDQTSLLALKTRHPELFSEPRHVMLLGCYTTTETSTLMWREQFPGATMIAGFEGRAPSRKVAASANFVTEVLGAADRLDKENLRRPEPLSEKAVRDTLRGLESVRITASAIDYCTHRIEGIPGAKLSCDDQWLTFTAMSKEIDRRFLSPEDPQEDPPRQTDGTVLRSYYNKIQGMCPAENTQIIPAESREEFKRLRDELRDRVLRLLFWWNVQKNFAVFHEEELKAFATQLKDLKVQEELPKLDGNLGRKAFIQSIYSLAKGISNRSNEIRDEYQSRKPLVEDADDAAKEAFRLEGERLEREYGKCQDAMTTLEQTYVPLMNLQRDGIPGNWIEADTALAGRGSHDNGIPANR